MDDEEDIIREYQRRRKMYLYSSFLVCLTGGALVAAAMGTQNWVTADVYDKNATDDTNYHGDFRGGLFQGMSTLVTTLPVIYDYYTVCDEGECLYSCAETKEKRMKHLDSILSGHPEDIENPPCLKSASRSSRTRNSAWSRRTRSLSAGEDDLIKHPLRVIENYEDVLKHSLGIQDGTLKVARDKDALYEGNALKLSSQAGGDDEFESNQASRAKNPRDLERSPSVIVASISGDDSDPEIEKSSVQAAKLVNVDSSDADQTLTGEYLRGYSQADVKDADEVSRTDGLMSQGLWVGTIACLSGGLLFALVGAVFAIVNTATTPIEAITGVTGLYIWNGLAGTFDLVAVILWSVMFGTRLSNNVLVEQSTEGWTTEGKEVLGYSFWLVVVAILVHIGNCGVIAYGTYEPKRKEKIQEPDKATNDILLY